MILQVLAIGLCKLLPQLKRLRVQLTTLAEQILLLSQASAGRQQIAVQFDQLGVGCVLGQQLLQLSGRVAIGLGSDGQIAQFILNATDIECGSSHIDQQFAVVLMLLPKRFVVLQCVFQQLTAYRLDAGLVEQRTLTDLCEVAIHSRAGSSERVRRSIQCKFFSMAG